jgi:hypothetical protein
VETLIWFTGPGAVLALAIIGTNLALVWTVFWYFAEGRQPRLLAFAAAEVAVGLTFALKAKYSYNQRPLARSAVCVQLEGRQTTKGDGLSYLRGTPIHPRVVKSLKVSMSRISSHSNPPSTTSLVSPGSACISQPLSQTKRGAHTYRDQQAGARFGYARGAESSSV